MRGAAGPHGAAERVLREVFGFERFRPGQREVVEAVLAGRDCIAVMPTGAGKSLTFQLPARLLPGTVLVLDRTLVAEVAAFMALAVPGRRRAARAFNGASLDVDDTPNVIDV